MRRLLEDGRGGDCATREVVGSRMLKDHMDAATAMGYNVRSYDRVKQEVLIDDKMHAQILDVISDTDRYPGPQTLVLATGVCACVCELATFAHL